MAYTSNLNQTKTITWPNNPYSADGSVAVITNNELTSFTVTNAQGVNIIYTVDVALLQHLFEIIPELLNEITPS